MSERPKEHASKACEVQASVGSNPTATATVTSTNAGPPAQGAPGVSLAGCSSGCSWWPVACSPPRACCRRRIGPSTEVWPLLPHSTVVNRRQPAAPMALAAIVWLLKSAAGRQSVICTKSEPTCNARHSRNARSIDNYLRKQA